MRKNFTIAGLLFCVTLISCENDSSEFFVNEDASSFREVGTIKIGGTGAAEISAYDPATKKLFVVNNSGANKVDVVDFRNPNAMTVISSIDMAAYNGASNSVAVKDGLLAVAMEALPNKQESGKVLIFKTDDLSLVTQVTVGALPDMVTFSPDGNFILTANEGEPNADYSVDPEGSISIISVKENYSVTTLNFASFANQQADLVSKGFRVFGANANFAKDIEPEYISVSEDSKLAWVTLQENNGIATIDLISKTITGINALGSKDFSAAGNEVDLSDQDGGVTFKSWSVKGLYQPDAIHALTVEGTTYLFTANEGDAREYNNFVELRRVGSSSYVLDATKFPNATTIKQTSQLGRLNATPFNGDTDRDNDFDEIFTIGARSFSIWNASSGALVFDSKNELDVKSLSIGVYDDARSDDKGSEPEGIVVGNVGTKKIAFVGMERSDAIAVYDVTNPQAPQFIQIFRTGDAPEGLLFIPAKDSPWLRSLLVVSSENDGTVKVYQPLTINQ